MEGQAVPRTLQIEMTAEEFDTYWELVDCCYNKTPGTRTKNDGSTVSSYECRLRKSTKNSRYDLSRNKTSQRRVNKSRPCGLCNV